MVSRRDFIGSVIATVVGTGIPFRALRGPSFQPYDVDILLSRFSRIIELMRAPRDRQMASRVLLRLDNKEIIRGPEILRIEQPPERHPMTIICDDLEVTKSINVMGFVVINDKNQLVTEMSFDDGPCPFWGPERHKEDWIQRHPGESLPEKPFNGDKLIGRLTLSLWLS